MNADTTKPNSPYLDEYRNKKGKLKKRKIREALKVALNIRKFEIELYWKRAAYFWAFITVTFAAYAAVGTGEFQSYSLQIMVAVLGILLSLSWVLVNRGSRFWQKNWEAHVDHLEDEVVGQLYKKVFDEQNDFHREPGLCNWVKWQLTSSNFSVSRINAKVSYFVLILWVLLFIRTVFLIFPILNPYWEKLFPFTLVAGSILLVLAGTAFLLNTHSKNSTTSSQFDRRTTEDGIKKTAPPESDAVS